MPRPEQEPSEDQESGSQGDASAEASEEAENEGELTEEQIVQLSRERVKEFLSNLSEPVAASVREDLEHADTVTASEHPLPDGGKE